MDSHFLKLSDGSFMIRIGGWKSVPSGTDSIDRYIRDHLFKMDPELITYIDINGYDFEVPSDMFSSFKNLISLEISGNDLLVEVPDLPDTLECLSLESAPIRKLPERLPSNLRTLNVMECTKLEALPEKFPENFCSLSIDDCHSLEYDYAMLPESLIELSIFSEITDEIPKETHFKDLRLPNLKLLEIFEHQIGTVFKFSNCVFSLGIECIQHWRIIGFNINKSPLLKRHTLETYSRIYASRRTRHLDDHANLIKSRFELWSLYEEGARFERAQREYKEFFG